MTFYFKPPRGTVSLQNLDQCMSERIKYLKDIESLTNITDFEQPVEFQYLTEGSALDRAGHYMLRLLSFTVPNLYPFLFKYETILFEKRLKSMEPSQVQVELKTVRRHLQELEEGGWNFLPKHNIFLQTMVYVCEQIAHRTMAEHTFNTTHSNTCEDFSLEVPFTTCLSLVERREVEIKLGTALVPCGKWQSLLVCLFKLHLEFGMDQLRKSTTHYKAFEDSRIQYLSQLCPSSSLCKKRSCQGLVLKSGDVDCQSRLFPPCMASLHKTLRLKHRLSHNARFHYSAFLKDIGMPIEEAIEFWKNEYMKSPSGGTKCSHSWLKDSRRYLYSIRHLYGLEGDRKERSVPGCKKLQNLSLGPTAEGGCPFQHFDESELIATMPIEIRKDKDVVATLMEINRTKGPQSACQRYHSLVQKLVEENVVGEDETFKPGVYLDYNPASFYDQHVVLSKKENYDVFDF